MNIGEELVSSYLRYILGCEFVQKNLSTVESQGEIDVVGINLKEKTVYICEVATHLITGLLYTKGTSPNNVQKLTEKLSRDIVYAKAYFPEYTHHFMLWSPIVKSGKDGAKHSQIRDIEEIKLKVSNQHQIEVECIMNEDFSRRIEEMRDFARTETKELKCPVMRFLQIEEHLNKHVEKINS